MLLARRDYKNLLLFVCGCLLYSYAFFNVQPDRSFEEMKRQNDELRLREKMRQEQLKAKRNGEDLDIVPEVGGDEGPEWQRKMRAMAGEMAWKREQEQLAAAGHSNLRGAGGERHNNSNPLLDFLVMMSVFVITRTLLRACLFYRNFSRMMQANGGDMPPPPPLIPFSEFNATTTTTRNSATTRRNSNNNNNNNSRGALSRLMVPSANHFAAVLRNARFRQWVTQLNEQRDQNGQPPLSSETLRLMMRDNADFDGNDYDALMQFHEEANHPTAESMTPAEIHRACPPRTLNNPRDELLAPMPKECAICLEKYQRRERVRRLPCGHEFHVGCIDPWLVLRAVCPICKHPIVGGSAAR